MGHLAVILGCYLFAALFLRLLGGFNSAADAISAWGRGSSLRRLRRRGETPRSYARSRISS
ncbi:MAG: hypothetical protein ABI649_10660 [Gaiellaceae bacterium]